MRITSLAFAAGGLVLGGLAVAAPASAADLTVTVEIPRLPVAEYHAPYVSIWVENPDKTAAATLAVLYDVRKKNNEGQQWLKDIRTWWRKAGRTMTFPADGVSSPTKAPGRHTLKFAGASGPLAKLPAGDYMLVVETARELGGAEAVRVPIKWGGPATTATAKGATELGAVSVAITR